MKKYRVAWVVLWAIFFASVSLALFDTAEAATKKKARQKEVTLDFNNVDLPVLVKLVGELTGKNFIIDEKVRGKVSIISPTKIPLNRVYEVFLSVLEMKGLTVVKVGTIHQIRPFAEVTPDRSIHIYTLKNMKAEDISKVLRGLVSKPAGRRGKAGKSKGLSGQVQILSDKESNSLIITASESDFRQLKAVIEKLDVRTRQVYVEAVILEMEIDKQSKLGTDLGGAFAYISGGQEVAVIGGVNNSLDVGALSSLKNLLGVSSLGSVNFQAVIQALKTSDNVNVLSTPQILTSDKQKAEIVIAENIPFPGAQSQSVGGNVQTTIERKDVGIILRFTPNILEDNRVRLDLYQEISDVVNKQTAGPVNLGPTTKKRSASTTVVVRDRQTIIVGGLIRDNIVSSERKVPLLGDIPLLGWLFKSTTKKTLKTNLMIFLTPYIINDDDELEEIRSRKTEESSYFMEDNTMEEQEARTRFFNEMVNLPR